MTVDHFKIRSKVYAKVLSRWVLIAALVFSATMTGGIYITDHVVTKVYSATASFRVRPLSVHPEAYSGWTLSTPQSRAIEADLVSVESPEVLKAVVSNLDLDQVWAERVYKRSEPLSDEEAVHYLASNLEPKFKHDSNIVAVTAMSDDPREAAAIANEVARVNVAMANGVETIASKPRDGGVVQITEMAVIPKDASHPNRRFCFALTAAIAGMLSVMVASAVEVCMLIARAEANSAELLPPR